MDKYTSSEEILENFDDLSSPVVYAIGDASNPEYKIAYLVQQADSTQELVKPTKVQEMLLGWKPTFKLLRIGQTVRQDIFNDLGIDVGYVFKDFNIKVSKGIEPAYNGQLPITDVNGKVELINGFLAYEYCELVYGEVDNKNIEADSTKTTKRAYTKKAVKPANYIQKEEIEEKGIIDPNIEQAPFKEEDEVPIVGLDSNSYPVDSNTEEIEACGVEENFIPEVSMDDASKEKLRGLEEELSEEQPEEKYKNPKKVFSLLDEMKE